jgi:hypothetical protein
MKENPQGKAADTIRTVLLSNVLILHCLISRATVIESEIIADRAKIMKII